jgi:6-phosphogluconolactonase
VQRLRNPCYNCISAHRHHAYIKQPFKIPFAHYVNASINMTRVSRRHFIAGSSAAVLAANSRWVWADANTLRVYVGCFTFGAADQIPSEFGGQRPGGEQPRGLYTFTFDTRTGRAGDIYLAVECSNPVNLIAHSHQRFIYACRGQDSRIDGQNLITAFAIRSDGSLQELNTVRSGGGGPTVGVVDKAGKHLLTTNFSTNSIVCFGLMPDGSLGERTAMIGKEPVGAAPEQGPQRNDIQQSGPPQNNMAAGMVAGSDSERTKPHSIVLSKSERFAIAAEISANRCHVMRFNASTGSLVTHQLAVDTQRTGPRHLAWHPSYRFLYSSGEEGSAITAWRWDEDKGALNSMQSLSTVPTNYSGRNQPADVVVHPSGRFVYVTNRGAGTLAGYRIDQSTGLLTNIGHAELGSSTSWSMLFDPTGRWALAAAQVGDAIVMYSVDPESGELKPTDQTLHTILPTCIRWAQA